MRRALELRQEAGRLVNEARGILKKSDEEKRALTAEDQERFDTLHRTAEDHIATAERLEHQERVDALEHEGGETRVVPPSMPGSELPVTRRAQPEYRDSFRSFLRQGLDLMPSQQRATLQVDSAEGGGLVVASEQFVAGILQTADNIVAIRQLARGFQVGYEETLGQPTLDGDLSTFEWAGELTESEEDTGLAFGLRELKPKALKRKHVKMSKRLLESPRLNTEQIVTERAAVALANTLESAYCTGNGANQPLGLFTASEKGINTDRDVSTANTSSEIRGDGLISAQGALKDAYQREARWLFHRDAITQIRKLKDGEGQYLWQPGLQLGEPNLILGKPYVTSDYVPNTFSSSAYVGMYGDFSYYYYADAFSSMTIQRLVELYALTGQVALLFDRLAADGMPVLSEAFVRIKLGA